MLEYFFSVDNLLSGNMRYTMLGTELSDPLKYNDYNIKFTSPAVSLSQKAFYAFDDLSDKHMKDIKQVINNWKEYKSIISYLELQNTHSLVSKPNKITIIKKVKLWLRKAKKQILS